jgi:hypothetical protein
MAITIFKFRSKFTACAAVLAGAMVPYRGICQWWWWCGGFHGGGSRVGGGRFGGGRAFGASPILEWEDPRLHDHMN